MNENLSDSIKMCVEEKKGLTGVGTGRKSTNRHGG
jgi:hypothetical protein